MADHAIGNLASARWLLWQATFGYVALIPLSIVCAWAVVQARRTHSAIYTLALPFFWLLPIGLAGAFTDWSSQEAKTADWVGTAALSAMALQLAMSVWVIVRLKGLRGLGAAAVLVNGVIGLLSLLVVAMDASGDWL